ncbi:KH domain RNA-binding protein [Rhodotorula toruloides NP11]|uniref:KH domain RNA-binding protein n=1 Tax=Rhodotorula toruloides (strain NP11) TaxID=1130832 RepID=M7X3L3_RHOT1|nr:KH domain RNA-binding protein [Rhodotorula toruloides NP11]EMS24921.1 KH domain RNA-binding protein [Rhodotorula toruloides NP11]
MSSDSSPAAAAAPSTSPSSASNPQTQGGPPANTPAAAPTAATIANSGNPDAIHQPGQTEDDGLTLRALVSSKEAGVIIGRAGATIAQIRTDANVKAGVSKVVPGVPDRVLSIGGTVESVAKAYSLVAQTILENPVPSGSSPSGGDSSAVSPSASASIRLLISHLLIGSVIGKGGSKIRQIQELAQARMVASKEMLPQSTERIVEVTGQPESVRLAVQEIAKCLIEDWDRSQGTGGFGGPRGGQQRVGGQGAGAMGMNPFVRSNGGMQGQGGRRQQGGGAQQGGQAGAGGPSLAGTVVGNESDPNWREQKISIPSDMVGCIIGRGGTKINEIRRMSGSRISIAKTAHDETGERMFVISGLPENNEKALYLLYNQLESEKERRVQSVQEEQAAAAQQAKDGNAAGDA